MPGYRKAAEQGDAVAQFNLGAVYAAGEGVPQDYAEALKWYRRAAEQGDAVAQFQLGHMYHEGEGWGGPQDYIQAHMWFNLAAANLPTGEEFRDRAVEARNNVEELMTPEQIAEAQRLAREWKPKKEGK